jgi:GxxExxY protein
VAVDSNLFPDLTYRILGSAMKVHRALGPGLLERTYRRCLEHQLRADGMQVNCEVPIDIHYAGLLLEAAYFADLIVDDKVLVELKAVDQILPVHSMQVVTYLKLAGLPVGLLINFNESRLTNGLRRFANSAALEGVPRTVPPVARPLLQP